MSKAGSLKAQSQTERERLKKEVMESAGLNYEFLKEYNEKVWEALSKMPVRSLEEVLVTSSTTALHLEQELAKREKQRCLDNKANQG